MARVAVRRAARRKLDAFDAAAYPWLSESDQKTALSALREAAMTPEEREAVYRENRAALYRKGKVGGHG